MYIVRVVCGVEVGKEFLCFIYLFMRREEILEKERMEERTEKLIRKRVLFWNKTKFPCLVHLEELMATRREN